MKHRNEHDLFLQPGEIRFERAPARIHTLLGSCVALTFWHPARLSGAMCHYLLPDSKGTRDPRERDGKFADLAFQCILSHIRGQNYQAIDYIVRMYGGANSIFPGDSTFNVGKRNVEAADRLIEQHGFKLAERDVGGQSYRRMYFDLSSGEVWVQRGPTDRI